MKIVIRHATDVDLPAIAAILNTEIAESPFLYAEVPVTLEERQTWLAAHRTADLPVLVAEDADTRSIVGWAALSTYRPSSGYRFTAEVSIFAHRSWHRRGIGSQLIAALENLARSRDLHALVGSVDAANTASIEVLARFGFVEVARLPEVGRKFGEWRTQLLVLHRLSKG